MTRLTGQERATYVQNMFTRIARRYDLMNRLMTGGQDIRWRKQVIKLARLHHNTYLLDLGTGTGDLAREALEQFPRSKVIAADFTLEMMRVGQKRGALNFSSADALQLPRLLQLLHKLPQIPIRHLASLCNSHRRRYESSTERSRLIESASWSCADLGDR